MAASEGTFLRKSYKANLQKEYRARQGATIQEISNEVYTLSGAVEDLAEGLERLTTAMDKYTRKIDRLLERSE